MNSVSDIVRNAILAILASVFCIVGVVLMSIAAFVYIEDMYGSLYATIAIATAYLVLGIIIFTVVSARQKASEQRKLKLVREARRAKEEEKPAGVAGFLADPMLMSVGMQLVRTIGIKRLIPLAAVAAAAAGYLATRSSETDGGEDA